MRASLRAAVMYTARTLAWVGGRCNSTVQYHTRAFALARSVARSLGRSCVSICRCGGERTFKAPRRAAALSDTCSMLLAVSLSMWYSCLDLSTREPSRLALHQLLGLVEQREHHLALLVGHLVEATQVRGVRLDRAPRLRVRTRASGRASTSAQSQERRQARVWRACARACGCACGCARLI